MATGSTQVRQVFQVRRRAPRPFRVTVRGHGFQARYQADSLFEALVLARAVKRGWPHARVHVSRPGLGHRAAGRWVA